jgi:hypothetical protein
MYHKGITGFLMVAGILPFVIFTYFLMVGVVELPFVGHVGTALKIYSVLILTFIMGSHWGMHLSQRGPHCRFLAIISNVLFLFLLWAFFVLSLKVLYFVMSLLFLFLFLLDSWLWQGGFLDGFYIRCRALVTFCVCFVLVLSGVVI